MECPKCGEYIDRSMFASDVVYCPYCGQDLKAPPPPVNLSYCPYCGQELVPGALYCPRCGKKLAVKARKKENFAYIPSEQDDSYTEKKPSPVKSGVNSVTRFLTYLFSSERKMRRLYGQWAEYADLSPEEIKALEAQTETSQDWQKRERVLKISLLAVTGLIVVIVIVALLVLYVF